MNLFLGVAALEREADVAEAVGIGRDQARLDQIASTNFAAPSDLPVSRLRMPLPSACLKVRPMAITSPTHFICVPSTGSAPGNFSNCQRGNLDDHVIDGRLEAGRRLARDVVLDFVQAIADGELRGDLRDGESGGLRGQRGAARHARIHLHDHHAARLRD